MDISEKYQRQDWYLKCKKTTVLQATKEQTLTVRESIISKQYIFGAFFSSEMATEVTGEYSEQTKLLQLQARKWQEIIFCERWDGEWGG